MTGNPLVDYFLGTFLLAAASVLIGEATVTILRRVNKRHMERLDAELALKHEASMKYRQSGDDEAYRNLNREANDAFGRVFFNLFTFSAASLWFAFFVLAWMQTRFISLEFRVPLVGITVGYVFTFLLLYIMARVIVGNLRNLANRKDHKFSVQEK